MLEGETGRDSKRETDMDRILRAKGTKKTGRRRKQETARKQESAKGRKVEMEKQRERNKERALKTTARKGESNREREMK